jgi:hypothetical protein
VRLVDIIIRGGHLSEQTLIEAVMTGERPAHLDRCDICAERAVELGRWLDEVRATGTEAADAAFPPERLLAQQQQIMRRLEQLDQPKRVIAFPSQSKLARDMGGRRVAAGWVAVAAAAGIVLGVVSSQATERLASRGKPPAAAPAAAQPATPQDQDAATDAVTTVALNSDSPLLNEELDRPIPSAFEAMASLTPRMVAPHTSSVRAPK